MARIGGFGAAGSASVVGGVVSAGSYAAGGVAPGEIVYIGGTNIGPAAIATLVVEGGTRISTSIGNTQILFDDKPAPLIYVSATAASAIVPYAVAGKTSTQVVVVLNGARSAPFSVPRTTTL